MERVFKPQSLCAEWKSEMKREMHQSRKPLRNKWLGKQKKKQNQKKKKRKAGENVRKTSQSRKKNHGLPRHTQWKYTQIYTHTQTHTQGYVTRIHMCRCEEET